MPKHLLSTEVAFLSSTAQPLEERSLHCLLHCHQCPASNPKYLLLAQLSVLPLASAHGLENIHVRLSSTFVMHQVCMPAREIYAHAVMHASARNELHAGAHMKHFSPMYFALEILHFHVSTPPCYVLCAFCEVYQPTLFCKHAYREHTFDFPISFCQLCTTRDCKTPLHAMYDLRLQNSFARSICLLLSPLQLLEAV